MKIFIFLSFLVLLAGCKDFPKDPHNTFEQFKSGERALVVGILHAPPHADISNQKAEGHEVEALKQFSQKHGGKMEFKDLGFEEGFDLLEDRKIDMLLGGIHEGTPFEKVGYTRPYDGEHVLAIVRGENRFATELEVFLKNHFGENKGQ